MKINTIIFDLDGTLIDSAPSIVSSIQFALNIYDIEPDIKLTSNLIGPPISEIIKSLLPKESKDKLTDLVNAFKQHYDDFGYKESSAYKGVTEILTHLKYFDLKLYIATNKRSVPTKKIIQHFNWSEFFVDCISSDSDKFKINNKNKIIHQLLESIKDDKYRAIYIGDRSEDSHAATENNIEFIWAKWGYGQQDSFYKNCIQAHSPAELISIIQNIGE